MQVLSNNSDLTNMNGVFWSMKGLNAKCEAFFLYCPYSLSLESVGSLPFTLRLHNLKQNQFFSVFFFSPNHIPSLIHMT